MQTTGSRWLVLTSTVLTSTGRIAHRIARTTVVVTLAAGVWALAARELWSGRQSSWAAVTGDRPATLDEVIGAAATIIGLGCLAWLAIAVGCALLAPAPGRLGAVSTTVGGWITPVVVRRVLSAMLGVGLIGVIPAAAQAAPLGMAPSGVAASSLTPGPSRTEPPLPSLDRPGAPATSPPPPRAPAEITVRPGDCLWTIAAEHLGSPASNALIDREWLRWYAANRDVIGADPDVLQPGQRLVLPS